MFALLERLAIVAIIANLVAMLLPVLARATARGHYLYRADNLGELAVGCRPSHQTGIANGAARSLCPLFGERTNQAITAKALAGPGDPGTCLFP